MEAEERHISYETARKLVHIAFGFVALALRWLTWHQALLLGAAAIVFNLLILPRVGGRFIARHRRGWDAGILLYPVMVFLLIFVFRRNEEIAGVAWAALAFGDGAATLLGRVVGGPKLPWNRDKSWSGSAGFLEVGIPAAYFIALVLNPQPTLLPLFFVVSITVLAAAIAESLPTGIDDNVSVAVVAAATMWWLSSWTRAPELAVDEPLVWLLIANVILGTLGFLARAVNLSGWIGGIALGSVLILFGGWPAYAVLLAFFVLGTGATKLGYRRKAAEGLAQEGGGRRGFGHAFANVGFATICVASIALTDWRIGVVWLAAVAAFATAAADTVSSEIGQLIGKRAFLPLSFKRVERGTEGAISLEGTLTGLVAGFTVSFLGIAMLAWKDPAFHTRPFGEGWKGLASAGLQSPYFWKAVGIATVAAFAGSYVESVIGSWNRRRATPISNGALNFLNTVAGGVIAIVLAKLLNLPI